MKDPLSYFIAEGFGQIFAYRLPDGRYTGEIRYNGLNTNFKPIVVANELVFPNQNPTVTYQPVPQFYEKYATIVDSAEEMNAAALKYDAEWNEVIKFVSIIKNFII